MVRTSHCGRDNPGSTPGEDMYQKHATTDALALTKTTERIQMNSAQHADQHARFNARMQHLIGMQSPRDKLKKAEQKREAFPCESFVVCLVESRTCKGFQRSSK